MKDRDTRGTRHVSSMMTDDCAAGFRDLRQSDGVKLNAGTAHDAAEDPAGERAFAGDLCAACAATLGIGEDLGPAGDDSAGIDAKRDWVRRADQFATRYFAGDAREMTDRLKRVNDAKRWEDLTREYVPVDWTKMRETADATGRVELDAACMGGACAI